MKSAASGTILPSASRLRIADRADLPTLSPLTLARTQPTVRSAYPSVSPLHSNDFRWYRNLYLLSIAYGLRPQLRSRLTLSGRAFLRKPWIFGGQDSHLSFATHANILSRMKSTKPYSSASARIRCSSTNSNEFPSFGSKFEPRLSSAQSHSTSELLRTL